MINEFTALMYGLLIGYGICAVLHKKKYFNSDKIVLVLMYLTFLFLTLGFKL